MTDLSYIKMISMSDDALAKQVGLFIKHKRLEQNKTQDMVSSAAGISRSTLSLLESAKEQVVKSYVKNKNQIGKQHECSICKNMGRISWSCCLE
jgi:hypothetical protein